MTINNEKWFEIWYSEGEDILPHYLLIVIPNSEQQGEIIVLDPSKDNEIIYTAKSYENIRFWLTEDEFELIQGRTFPDDGW